MARTIAETITAAETIITAYQSERHIRERLALVGYHQEQIATLRSLLDDLITLGEFQQQQYEAQYAATDRFNAHWDAIKTQYAHHITIARLLFSGDVSASYRLQLAGRRERTFGAWYTQASNFYTHALNDEQICGALARYGVSRQMLEHTATQIETADTLHGRQRMATVSAKAATQRRVAALETLQSWISTFFRVARIAFAEQPAHLQTLGIANAAQLRPRPSIIAEPITS